MQSQIFKICLILCIACCITVSHILSQTIKRMDDYTWNNINQVVSTEFNEHNLKGISVAVVYGGNVAYANAFGDKNEAGDPFTIETKSLLASLSKLITGVMAMKLVENGVLGLDDEVGDYINAYDGSDITVRHLLSHMSGIAHYSDCPPGYDGDWDAGQSLLTVLGCSTCMTPPGGDRIYTTYGTTLLGVLIDQVGIDQYGLGFESLYDTWLHDPGGLGTLEPSADNLDPDLAEGEAGPGYWNDLGWKLPGGGFISDIVDLADFARGMLNNTFISRPTFDSMMVVPVPSGWNTFTCGELSNSNFGLAFVVDGMPGELNIRLSHNGENETHGYFAHLSIYPNRNAAIVIMTNTDNVPNAMSEIVSGVEDFILCPYERNFTNDIDWTEPRIFEGEFINGSSELTTTNNAYYVFDAERRIQLKPGFHVPAGKKFLAIAWDECGGDVLTD
jgi:CubicO group peptidase (beta-lactamase class C family)